MPAESSIYWDSVGSQRSASGGSSGSSGRHYVDPWDLENYAYLRRHSVAGVTQSPRHCRARGRRYESHSQTEYWCNAALREPGYDAPAFVEELRCGARQPCHACYCHQPIYEDEVPPDYAISFPVYTPLSDLRHRETIEDRRRCGYAPSRTRERLREEYRQPELSNGEPCAMETKSETYETTSPSPHLDLNTCERWSAPQKSFLRSPKGKCAMRSVSTFAGTGERAVKRMDQSVFEQICDTIFTLIPEVGSDPYLQWDSVTVPRLKRLFLNWCQLGADERAHIDERVNKWCDLDRRRMYKPLREALTRWENIQDTEGAPGCEPGTVSFSCDPRLEEELVNVICSLEVLFLSSRRNGNEANVLQKLARKTSLSESNEISSRCVASLKDRSPHSVHSCGYIFESGKTSDDELGGYATN